MSRARYGWAFVLMTACGSAAPPPQTAAAEEPKAAEPAAENEPASASPAAKDAVPAKEAEPEPATTLSAEDLATVLQAVLNDPELDGYLHAEKPGRKPVKLSGPDLPKNLKLVKSGYPVTIVDGPKSPKDPVVVVTRIALEGNTATVTYRYDVEKIRGATRVKNGKSGWELMSSRISEL